MTTADDAENNMKALIMAGLDPEDLAPIHAAIEKLRSYEGLGEPKSFLYALRRSDLMAEHISALPMPVQQAWVHVLTERKAI